MPSAPSNSRSPDSVVVHPLDPGDAPIAAAARAATKAVKGVRLGVDGRGQYDGFMESVASADGLTVEKGAVGGVEGVWVRPPQARSDEAILYLHGGWFNFGSAWAYRNFVGHIAKRARANAFIVGYRLAPEHPFPTAIDDALAGYRALGALGIRRIAVVGDSAGGNLSLALASRIIGDANPTPATLVGVVAFSPVTDLTLSGASYETRAEADPLFTRAQVADLVAAYLGGADPKLPTASPLNANLSGLPPIRIHVGDDEVLLDDSLRYGERAIAAGVDARVNVWMGLAHGFVVNVGRLKAAGTALDDVGAFVLERLTRRSRSIATVWRTIWPWRR
jgi:monoterpene epsilon-lactone hydrolase